MKENTKLIGKERRTGKKKKERGTGRKGKIFK